MQLRHLRLEIFFNIFLRSLGFWALLYYKKFYYKKCVVCNQHYHNIHDPSKLVNAFRSSILLFLGLLIIQETLLKHLPKGTQSSVKLEDWGLQSFLKMKSSIGVFEEATQICGSFLKSLRLPNQKFWAKKSFILLFLW